MVDVDGHLRAMSSSDDTSDTDVKSLVRPRISLLDVQVAGFAQHDCVCKSRVTDVHVSDGILRT